jgi:hypothetical protein
MGIEIGERGKDFPKAEERGPYRGKEDHGPREL